MATVLLTGIAQTDYMNVFWKALRMWAQNTGHVVRHVERIDVAALPNILGGFMSEADAIVVYDGRGAAASYCRWTMITRGGGDDLKVKVSHPCSDWCVAGDAVNDLTKLFPKQQTRVKKRRRSRRAA